MGRSTCIAVVSVHRSGSSCVGGVLHALGVPMGVHLVLSSPSNRLGHFEDDVLGSIHRQMLGGNWRYPELDAEPHMDVYREQICYREQRWWLWGIKDPRLCFLFPYLVRALADDTELRVIRVRRPLEETVQSMLLRAQREPSVDHLQVTAEEANEIAHTYDDALKASLADWNGPMLTVDFGELVADRRRGVAEIADFVGVPVTARAVSFVLPRLKHI